MAMPWSCWHCHGIVMAVPRQFCHYHDGVMAESWQRSVTALPSQCCSNAIAQLALPWQFHGSASTGRFRSVGSVLQGFRHSGFRWCLRGQTPRKLQEGCSVGDGSNIALWGGGQQPSPRQLGPWFGLVRYLYLFGRFRMKPCNPD